MSAKSARAPGKARGLIPRRHWTLAISLTLAILSVGGCLWVVGFLFKWWVTVDALVLAMVALFAYAKRDSEYADNLDWHTFLLTLAFPAVQFPVMRFGSAPFTSFCIILVFTLGIANLILMMRDSDLVPNKIGALLWALPHHALMAAIGVMFRPDFAW